jgi:hypothetical protein
MSVLSCTMQMLEAQPHKIKILIIHDLNHFFYVKIWVYL